MSAHRSIPDLVFVFSSPESIFSLNALGLRGLTVAVEALLPLDRFKSFLARSGIQHPDEKAIGNCIRYLSSRLSIVSDIDMAVELYREAGRIPCTTTRAAVRDDSNITVNGPLSEACPMVLSGATSTGRPLVIKIVDSAEEDTCCDLKLSDFFDSPESCNNLVPCTVVKLDHSAVEDVRTFKRSPPLTFRALVMPRYVCNLAELPQLDLECIARGGRALQLALEYIHGCSLVHMDVKAANVFIDCHGGWRLGDFGSCVGVGHLVTSYSTMFHPDKLKVANIAYDTDFLVVLLIVEMLKAGDEWKVALFESSCISATKILLWSSSEKVKHEVLNNLFGDLRSGMSNTFSAKMANRSEQGEEG